MSEKKKRARVYVDAGQVDEAREKVLSDKFDVVKLDSASPGAELTQEQIGESLKGVDAMLITPLNKYLKEMIEVAGPTLKVLSTISAGLNHLDLPALKKAGVRVGNTADVLTDGVAEHAVGLTLMTMHRVNEHVKTIEAGTWAASRGRLLYDMNGSSLYGKTVGIMGLGRIGVAVAERIKAFKVDKIIYNARHKKDDASKVGAEYVSFSDLLSRSDVLIVTAALNESNKGIFDK